MVSIRYFSGVGEFSNRKRMPDVSWILTKKGWRATSPNHTAATGGIFRRLYTKRYPAMLRHVAACLLFVCSAVPADPYQEAVAAFQAGRFSDALSILGQLGMDKSNTSAVQNLKALAAVELRRYPEALDSIRRARELAPDNPSYAYNHGLILSEARDFTAAKQVFLNALTRFGLNVRLLSGLGETLLRLNEFEEAEKRLR